MSEATFRIWRGLLEDSNPDDPWVASLRQARGLRG